MQSSDEICDQSEYNKELQEYVVQLKSILEENNHFYFYQSKQNEFVKNYRLSMEISMLQKQLPVDKTHSIFVIYDQSRMDFMKFAITGADDTPYANGFYLFDSYVQNNYPTHPPKINLMTTGNNKIRFNPNLYSNGYICLSLLGTWRGESVENWDPSRSNLYQILLSIQSIVMSNDVYFNEPGYEKEKKSNDGKKLNVGYCNIVKYANIKYAMIEQLKNPDKYFEDIIKKHFYHKKYDILKTCSQWLQQAKTEEAMYNGLVQSHNRELAELFQRNNEFHDQLQKQIQELEILLHDIKIN